MPTLKPFIRLFSICIFLLSTSCVKDVDLSQVDEVVIPPTAAIDLVYFTLAPADFIASGSPSALSADDVVRLEFLDDDYIQTGLMSAEFTFKYSNTFPKEFISRISFLSKSNSVKYSFEIPVPAGSSAKPEVVNYTEIISEKRIQAIRNSYKMKIEIIMLPDSNPIAGSLQLKSKAFYHLEF